VEAMLIHEKRAHLAQSLTDHDLETTLTFRWRPTSDRKHHWNAHLGGAHMLAPKKANLSEPLMREKSRCGSRLGTVSVPGEIRRLLYAAGPVEREIL
jgi:hypothetical protein